MEFTFVYTSLLQSFFSLITLMYLLTSCSVSKDYSPAKKFPKQELQQDFSVLKTILEEKHPSLYWYTLKDSMDNYFDRGYESIQDSMTELQFGWKIIAPSPTSVIYPTTLISSFEIILS